MTRILLHYIFFASYVFPFCSCFVVVSGILGIAAASVGYATWEYTKCLLLECCSDNYIKLNISGLQGSLRYSLHGQHLVEQIVARSVRSHVNSMNPKKALVMAFHGRTGSGKNFVAKMITDHLYDKGMNSRFVHMYHGTQFLHSSKIEEYKEKLQQDIKRHTKECGQSLFIFDEVDKMPSGLLDVLSSYMDYHEKVDGIDYKKNIFIILSNAGGNQITKVSLDFWQNGGERENMQMKDIEPLISKGAFNELGGLHHSNIVKKNLIDLYVPFLPLEKKHVKLCIQDELRSRHEYADMDTVDKIAEELDYIPEKLELYSSSGCKKISQKVDLYVGEL